ncbi:hypothetical protein [Gudongella sp. DL1XJH-153]|uniref:hypothetical protein n=1 Tax=Gudongella sp. DL1XJH-153 TaxID=3409804 RepID=UPI003BB559B1
MYNINGNTAQRIEPVTFSELKMTESEIEELLRKNIEMICDEEESLLIVGRQVRNEKKGRSDLTAVDNNGSIVLIEIKRDRQDIVKRKEAFEFQAIRYAASYATINDTDELVKQIYSPYIEKYKEEFQLGILTSFELGIRKINEFLEVNDSINTFNDNQRIVLVASKFDEQTLSAVAWLNKNNVDISCYSLTPYRIKEEIYFDVDKILPTTDYDSYYVNIMNKSLISSKTGNKKRKKRILPKIDSMLEWGVVKPGDIIQAKNKQDEATLLANGNVMVDNEERSMQSWLKELYGWSSVQTYLFAIHKDSGKSLSEIRDEYIEAQEGEEDLS